mgnify:CR=1 FL=1
MSRMRVFRQSAVDLCFADSCILINILEFAASFENVSLISQTCREWNEIINKNKLTSESIWHKIAHGQYGPHEFEELERINPSHKGDAPRINTHNVEKLSRRCRYGRVTYKHGLNQ